MGYHWYIVEISWGIFSGIGQTNQHYLGVYMEIYRNGSLRMQSCYMGLSTRKLWESPISSTGSFHFP